MLHPKLVVSNWLVWKLGPSESMKLYRWQNAEYIQVSVLPVWIWKMRLGWKVPFNSLVWPRKLSSSFCKKFGMIFLQENKAHSAFNYTGKHRDHACATQHCIFGHIIVETCQTCVRSVFYKGICTISYASSIRAPNQVASRKFSVKFTIIVLSKEFFLW